LVRSSVLYWLSIQAAEPIIAKNPRNRQTIAWVLSEMKTTGAGVAG
jgi:hypothetical protein